MIRNKNEELTLELALESAKNLGDQIVFVDNNSTDKSVEIAKAFKEKYKLEEMLILSFDIDLKSNLATFADYYNYALSFCDREWVMKWDSDQFAEKYLCDKIRQTCDKYINDNNVHGFYIRNRVICRDKKTVYKGWGDECGIFKNIAGRTYVSNMTKLGLESLYKQREMYLDSALLDEFVWHLRFKSSEEFVKSRFSYPFFADGTKTDFEQYVKDNMGGHTFDELEEIWLKDIVEQYNESKYRKPIPQEIINLQIKKKMINLFEIFNPETHMQDSVSGKSNVSRWATLGVLNFMNFKTMLEVPSGLGVDYEIFKESGLLTGKYYLGVDLTDKFLEYCSKTKGMNVTKGNITKLPCNDKSYDLVYARGIFEHLDNDDYKTAIQECLRVAKMYVVLVFYRGIGTVKNKVYNSVGIVEQDYLRTEIESLFSNKDFKRYVVEDGHGSTYTIYKIKNYTECLKLQEENNFREEPSIIKMCHKAIDWVMKEKKDKQILSVLDVGCGDGYGLVRFKDEYSVKTLKGVDVLADRIKNAREKGLNCDCMDFYDFMEKDKYDLVFSSHSLEHFPYFENAIDIMTNALHSEGILALVVPLLKKDRPQSAAHFSFFETGQEIIDYLSNDYTIMKSEIVKTDTDEIWILAKKNK